MRNVTIMNPDGSFRDTQMSNDEVTNFIKKQLLIGLLSICADEFTSNHELYISKFLRDNIRGLDTLTGEAITYVQATIVNDVGVMSKADDETAVMFISHLSIIFNELSAKAKKELLRQFDEQCEATKTELNDIIEHISMLAKSHNLVIT